MPREFTLVICRNEGTVCEAVEHKVLKDGVPWQHYRDLYKMCPECRGPVDKIVVVPKQASSGWGA